MRKVIYGSLAFLVVAVVFRVRLLFNRTERIAADGISSVKVQELVANVTLGLAVLLVVAAVGCAVRLRVRRVKSEAALVAARKDPFFEEPGVVAQLKSLSEPSSVSEGYREVAREAVRLLEQSRRLVESFEKHTEGEALTVLTTVKRELFAFRVALLAAASSMVRRIEVTGNVDSMMSVLESHQENLSEAERLVEAAFAYMESREVNQEVDLKNLATSLHTMVRES